MKICQQQLFLNSLPSKFSLATTVFSNTEDPLDKICWDGRNFEKPDTPKIEF